MATTAEKDRKRRKETQRKRSKDTPWIQNRVCVYGAHAPIENSDLYDRELRIGHNFRNSMVELERERRERNHAALRALPGGNRLIILEQGISQKNKELSELRAQKKALNMAQRSKQTRDPKLEADIKAVTKRLERLRAFAKKIRTTLYDSAAWKQGEQSRKDWYNAESRRFYAEAGATAWGTTVRTQEETTLARKHPTPPKRKRFDGSGKVVVQLQGGLSVDEALSCSDTRLQIKLMPKEKDEEGRETGKRRGIWVRGSRKKRPGPSANGVHLDSEGYPMRFLGNAWVRMRIATRQTMVESTSKSYLARKEKALKDGRTFEPKMVSRDEPVWCTFPIILHRDLPKTATIKWAWLRRIRLGKNTRWEFQLVLAEDTRDKPADSTRATSGSVAIDIGWRLLPSLDDDPACGFHDRDVCGCPEGQKHKKTCAKTSHGRDCHQSSLRVAYWLGSDGREGELRLPQRLVCAYSKVHDVQSIRDDLFDITILGLREWAKRNPVPEWLKDELSHAHLWKRHARLFFLYRDWSEQRFDGDDAAFKDVEAWVKQSRHLMDYEANLRDQVLNWRTDLYRKFAAKLRREYKTVILEDIDMRTLAARKEPEDSHLEKETARKRRSLAAISTLRSALGEKVEIVKINPAGTSYLCHQCGLPTFAGKPDVVLTCSACGITVDRDKNGCQNILRAGLEKIAENGKRKRA